MYCWCCNIWELGWRIKDVFYGEGGDGGEGEDGDKEEEETVIVER